MPVIATFELDDLIATGKASREPKARHGGFRAAINHPHFFDRGHPGADQLCHLDFEWVGNSKTHALSGRRADSIDHHLGRVTEDRRPPRADVIDVFVRINIPDLGALRAINKKWVPT